ncbi:hypothetical protein ACSQ67_021021 [Phaseolus vulgaris]
MWFGKWNGGGSEVDTEASSDDGSLGASLCDSVGSDFGEDGEGEGASSPEEDRGMKKRFGVSWIRISLVRSVSCMGKFLQTRFSETLMAHGSLCSSKKEKVESPIGHGSSGYYMKENGVSSLNVVAATFVTKAEDEKARRVVGEGEDRCNE